MRNSFLFNKLNYVGSIPAIYILFVFIAIAISVGSEPYNLNEYMLQQKENNAMVINKAIVIVVRGTIDQGTKSHIFMAIDRAESENAALIIDINSPGGFLSDTFDIADRIFSAKIPIIGYASGDSFSGATLILIPTHILVVNPVALIGDAQPVTIGPTGSLEPITEPKIINPLVKKFEDMAKARNRNATLVKAFILNATVVNGEEAVANGVADYNARTLDELLSLLRNIEVETVEGVYRLEITQYEYAEDCISCRILSLLSDPTVSGVLLTIGIFSIIFAISSTNLIAIPPALIFLVLGLIGTGLQANLLIVFMLIAGIGFLIGGILLGGADGGVLLASGIILIAVGSSLLPITGREIAISGAENAITTVFNLSLGIGIGAGIVGGIIVWQVVKSRNIKTTLFEIKGKVGIAKTDIKPGQEGFVLVEGELWSATSSEEIKQGEQVIVVDRKDHILIVKKRQASE